MKFLLTLFIFLISFAGCSQYFTVDEFIKLGKASDDYFDTYVTKKGYQFEEVEDRDGFLSKSYSFSINGSKRYYVSKHNAKDKKIEWVSFQTPNSNHYLKMKEELKKNGFYLLKSDVFNGANLFQYKKDKYSFTVISGKEDVEDKKNARTVYGFNFKIYY